MSSRSSNVIKGHCNNRPRSFRTLYSWKTYFRCSKTARNGKRVSVHVHVCANESLLTPWANHHYSSTAQLSLQFSRYVHSFYPDCKFNPERLHARASQVPTALEDLPSHSRGSRGRGLSPIRLLRHVAFLLRHPRGPIEQLVLERLCEPSGDDRHVDLPLVRVVHHSAAGW